MDELSSNNSLKITGGGKEKELRSDHKMLGEKPKGSLFGVHTWTFLKSHSLQGAGPVGLKSGNHPANTVGGEGGEKKPAWFAEEKV